MQRVHLYPFRTQKLSSAMLKILVWRRTGKIGKRGHSSLAQSVEHLTVNQVVAGSSPAGGANRKNRHAVACLFFLFTFLVGSEPSRRHDSQCLPFAAMKSRRCGRRDRKVNLPFGRSSRRTNVMSQRAKRVLGEPSRALIFKGFLCF